MIGLDQLADVYTEDSSTGEMTVLAHSALPCHFYHLNRTARAAVGPERAEGATLRHVQYSYDYTLPEQDQCQLEDAEGTRWNPLSGTHGANTFGMRFRWVDVERVS